MIRRGVLIACLLAVLLVAGPPLASRPAAGDHGSVEVGYVDAPTTPDAVLAAGEYADVYTDATTGITVHVQYSGGVMGFALESPGRGWVAISLGAVLVGSNYTDVLAFALDNGSVRALDQVDHGWERHLDLAVGGTDDIIAAAAQATPGGILVEFQVPLDSADDNDHHFLPDGTYPFSLAFNATSTDFEAAHTAHSADLLLHIGPTPLFVRAKPTTLQVSDAPLVAGWPGTLVGVLRDDGGEPVKDHPVEFYLETTYGLLYLGLSRTNSLGKADLDYTPRAAGAWTFFVVFRGSGLYRPSNESVELVVAERGLPGGPILRPDTGIALVVLAVLAGVWSSYLFVAVQLSAIRRSGRQPLARLPSTQGEGGDKPS